MIAGKVTVNGEATVEVEVAGSARQFRYVQAVIDTGYNGYLTLPSDLISALGLPFVGHRRGSLADDSVVVLDVYLATVLWHGREKEVLAARGGGVALLGMSLLRGSRMTMNIVNDGDVVIDELA